MKLTEKNKSDVDKGEDHKLQYLLVYVGQIKYCIFCLMKVCDIMS